MRDVVVRTVRLTWIAMLGIMAGCDAGLGPIGASLGGGVAGGRGSVRVLFINNTPNRVACTFGTFDQTDQQTQPDFRQFALDGSALVLEGNGVSTILSLSCARTFSIGGPGLLNTIERNLPGAARSDDAFVDGAHFFVVATDDPAQAGGPLPELAGKAPPFEARLGMDFPCGALLIIRFELDDRGPSEFRTDFELIPAEPTR